MGLDWFDRMTDKIETKANQVLKKTGDNVADIGRNFVDTVVPRAPLAPEKRSNFLAQSRKATGANRHTRAANLPDDVLIEKRWTAQEKLRKYLGKTTGEQVFLVIEEHSTILKQSIKSNLRAVREYLQQESTHIEFFPR